MLNNDNLKMEEFCKSFINWIKLRTVTTHNEWVSSGQESYRSGIAFSYYEIYSLMQMQAKTFLIPKSVLDLSIQEREFLSLTAIATSKASPVESIPMKYKKTVIGWMKDNIWFIKEDALKSKQIANSKLNSLNDDKYDIGYSFNKGGLDGYFEIITYMQDIARKLGFSLKDVNLDDIDPNRDLLSQ